MEDKQYNILRPFGGLSDGYSPSLQPKDKYRFALNTVLETNDGDKFSVSCENSNEVAFVLPQDYIPIGKIYLNDNETLIFSCNKSETLSEIGIKTKDDKYTTILNFNLGFKVSHQIDAVYRLRRNCGRVIYFTDNYNPPRYFNIDKITNFKTGNFNDPYSGWDINKFTLISNYKIRPKLDKFEITETGNLPSGSYNFAIQYVDEDLNPTEFIEVYDTIIIYNDNPLTKEFKEVRGSTNEVSNYRDYGKTNKAIKILFDELDNSFPYYRIAILEANTGSGIINRVVYSNEISTQVKFYTYTGNNALTIGSEAEVSAINSIIERAAHIEQIDNRLLLSDITEPNINYCDLQKYASKIKADLIVKTIPLTDLKLKNNQKRGQIHTEDLGYMPGEIYPFNIHYIFEGNLISPGLHIPGRNASYDSLMSTDNELKNTIYRDFTDCTGNSLWGVDSQGDSLKDKNVRHHRFPLRSEVDIPLVGKTTRKVIVDNENLYQISITLSSEVNPEWCQNPEYYSIPVNVYFTLLDGTQKHIYTILRKDNEINQFNYTNSFTLWLAYVGEIDPTSVVVVIDDDNEIKHNVVATTSIEQIPPITKEINEFGGQIFGIKFSNIEKPNEEEFGGKKIIGYIITRADRDEDNKTILDSGVFTPTVYEEKGNFASHGFLTPKTDKLQKDVFALIHPEHKFNNKQYTPNKYIKEGDYVISSQNISEAYIEDVQPGTSYDSSIHKRREKDSDGFSLHVVTRNSNLDFVVNKEEFSDIKNQFYLDSLFSYNITDNKDKVKDIYNISADNRIGIVQFEKDRVFNTIPYVILKRDLEDPYSNYEYLTFYFQGIKYFDNEEDSVIELYKGDSYISPMRYTSSVFYRNSIKPRGTKSSLWRYIFGIYLIIQGIAIAIVTEGAAPGLYLPVIALGIKFISDGSKLDKLKQVYGDLYLQGLENTVNDDLTKDKFNPDRQEGKDGDDEVQWFSDTLTDLWFESQINMNWRMGTTLGITDFLNSPSKYNENELNNYLIDKVTFVDTKADGGRTYLGFSKAEIYDINKDYYRRERQKFYYSLSKEYDCCSNCGGNFNKRIIWSEQSFQEELTDNYRVFLPNNYKDLEGETGKVTDIVKYGESLIIFTEENLWIQRPNYQERIIGSIVSYLGTGEFFSLPAVKIVEDSSGNSYGTIHKFSTLKTKDGIIFISEKQKAVCIFNGKLNVITNTEDEYYRFQKEMPIYYDNKYFLDNNKNYQFRDNSSNPYGTGFISVFDPVRNRYIFTKKDFIIKQDLGKDYHLCYNNGNLIYFSDFQKTINKYKELGWRYVGIENCKMKFKKDKIIKENVEVLKTIPNNTDIHIFYDTSGSFGSLNSQCTKDIDKAVNYWFENFKDENPYWNGNIYFHQDSTEKWIKYPYIIRTTTYHDLSDEELLSKNIIIISFCNESSPVYHEQELKPFIGITQTQLNNFRTDRNFFLQMESIYNSFIGILYPIVFNSNSQKCGNNNIDFKSTKVFLQHAIASFYGRPLTNTEVNQILPNMNQAFTFNEWNDLITSLKGNNPYDNDGVVNYGWLGKWDRYADSEGNIIDAEQFNIDIRNFIKGKGIIEIEEKDFIIPEFTYLEGQIIEPDMFNNSFTKSFSLKDNIWLSYHSYLPNFYFNDSKNYYSWEHVKKLPLQIGDIPNNIMKYNKENHYLEFNGKKFKWIFEFVSNSNDIETKIFDYITFNTTAKKYDNILKQDLELTNVTFNGLIAYNSNQCTGYIRLRPKENTLDYLQQQTKTLNFNIKTIDNAEDQWNINSLRDIRINYQLPIFTSKIEDLQNEYYIDKVLNESSLSLTKDWFDKQPLRDKFLIVRFFYENNDNVKLIFNFAINNEIISNR